MALPRDFVAFGSRVIALLPSLGTFLSEEDDLACVWLCPRFPSEQNDELTLGTPDSASHYQVILTSPVSSFLKDRCMEVTNSKNQISIKPLCSFDISYCSSSCTVPRGP